MHRAVFREGPEALRLLLVEMVEAAGVAFLTPPVEELRRTVDLVVVFQAGKAADLVHIVLEPGSGRGQEHATLFENWRDAGQPQTLVALRDNGLGLTKPRCREFLDE